MNIKQTLSTHVGRLGLLLRIYKPPFAHSQLFSYTDLRMGVVPKGGIEKSMCCGGSNRGQDIEYLCAVQ
jgi:hypothetical protein